MSATADMPVQSETSSGPEGEFSPKACTPAVGFAVVTLDVEEPTLIQSEGSVPTVAASKP